MSNKYNFNNKTFSLVTNSEKGTVDSNTIFEYKQNGNLVTADYFGGTILYGKIIAKLKDDQLEMLYQCITRDNELKAGKAIAEISKTENNKIKLKLSWQWLDKNEEKGISEYIEN
jgi:hypothetical protein